MHESHAKFVPTFMKKYSCKFIEKALNRSERKIKPKIASFFKMKIASKHWNFNDIHGLCIEMYRIQWYNGIAKKVVHMFAKKC